MNEQTTETKHLTDLMLSFGEDVPEPEPKRVAIWTDGSAWPNPGPGGWGAVILSDGVRSEIRGRSDGVTTNNRMEITAAIEALRALSEPSIVTVYTDSRYLQGGADRCAYCLRDRERWKIGPIPQPWKVNRDLWLQLMVAMKGHRIHWEWVRGHADCAENNRADVLAQR